MITTKEVEMPWASFHAAIAALKSHEEKTRLDAIHAPQPNRSFMLLSAKVAAEHIERLERFKIDYCNGFSWESEADSVGSGLKSDTASVIPKS